MPTYGVSGTNFRGPWPDYVACVFVFLGNIITCRLCKLTPLDQAQVTLQLRVSLSDVVKQFLGGLPLAGEPEPAIAGPATKMYPRDPSL